ncbi:MAG: hypothetical protein LBG17_03800 [Bacteroidales bacterium]|jgi:uncharacterized lipoprotein NlpE involved in copper resistance|nr:hypothetical protein [Bacteroidales bacterium]
MKKLFSVIGAVALFAILALVSCKKEKEKLEDGIYICGDATPYAEPAAASIMHKTVDGAAGQVSNTLLEYYVPLQAGKTFQIATVIDNNVETKVGGTLAMTYSALPANYYNLAAGGTFSVAENGVYHITYETVLGKVVIAKVNKMSVFGSEFGWGDADMTASNDGKTYTLTNVKCAANSEWKIRYNAFWDIGVDDTAAPTVKVATSWGQGTNGVVFEGTTGTMDLLPAGGNISIDACDKQGIYTFTMNLVDGAWVATMTKTGEVTMTGEPNDDAHKLSFIGTLLGTSWDTDHDLTYVSTTDGVSLYTYGSLAFVADNEFKVRQAHDWGISYGYLAGHILENGEVRDAETTPASNFADSGGNIKVLADKTYTKVEFKISWTCTTDWTVNFIE